MVSVRDQRGDQQVGRQEIADVFAAFYESLFKARSAGLSNRPWEAPDGKLVPAFTCEEVQDQLQKMEKTSS